MLEVPQLSAERRETLRTILKMRRFAVHELKLPNNYSFRSFVDIYQPHIVYNVSAAPEFSLEPKKWCFLVVGCLSYKGYFKKSVALAEAKKLKAQGLDVQLGGVKAYSTLGWFADPVLNTFLDWNEADLSGLIFHELAHQLIYVGDDTAFNESFATAVELEGVKRWLRARGHPELIQKYRLAKRYDDEFTLFVMTYRQRLKTLYTQALPDAEKRIQKQKIIASLRRDYLKLKQSWNGYAGYDGWVQGEINNAKFAMVATYYIHVSAFENLLKQNENDLSRFYRAVIALGKLPRREREQRLCVLSSAHTNKVCTE